MKFGPSGVTPIILLIIQEIQAQGKFVRFIISALLFVPVGFLA